MDGKGAAVKKEEAIAMRASSFSRDKLKTSTEVLEYDLPYHLDMVQVPFSSVQLMKDNVISKQRPGTPNSSSVSSASSEGQIKVVGGDEEEQKDQKKTKELKPKKGNQKKLKQPRFAFMTKSEVDHLEDGYRWRKYGQKAVKNSPFPRSYYHCTTASCNVKKRVERSFSDPSIVVTTYEGQHNHPSPVKSRPNYSGIPLNRGLGVLAAQRTPLPLPLPLPFLTQQVQQSNVFDLSVPVPHMFGHNSTHLFAPPPQEPNVFRDHGLLQDLVHPHMFKKEI